MSRERLTNIAQEYVTCQLQQAKQLVLLLLHSCGYPDARTIPRSIVTLYVYSLLKSGIESRVNYKGLLKYKVPTQLYSVGGHVSSEFSCAAMTSLF